MWIPSQISAQCLAKSALAFNFKTSAWCNNSDSGSDGSPAVFITDKFVKMLVPDYTMAYSSYSGTAAKGNVNSNAGIRVFYIRACMYERVVHFEI